MLTRRPWGAGSVATRPPGPEPDTGARTFSPLTALLPDHVAPELLWLGAKWASLVSFGVTVGLLRDLEDLETDYPGINALRKAAGELRTYIENNASMIPNYAERHRYGERVSTGFVESIVNTVVGKRFCKRQQMQLRPRRPRRFVELTGGLNPSLARATQNRIEQSFLADTHKLVHDPRRGNRRSGAAPHRAQGIPQTSLSAVRQSGRAQRAHARPRLVGMQPLRAGHRPRSGADCYRALAHPPLSGVRRAARAPPATHENLLRPLPQCPLAYSPATPARVGREER